MAFKRRLLRVLLAATTLAVVWLVVTPASAAAPPSMSSAAPSIEFTKSILFSQPPVEPTPTAPPGRFAPLCDPRGAITFAPPPQIQDTETSLDIPPDCGLEINPFESRNYTPNRGAPPQLDFSSSQEPTSQAAVSLSELSFVERLPFVGVETVRAPSGVRSSLDRPPQE